jgi:hypothetical protein
MATATRRLGLLTSRQLRLMTDQALLTRTTHGQDSSGGESDSFETFGPYPVRLEGRPFTSTERVEGGRVVAQTTWTAYLPHGTSVLPTDTLTINNFVFEVVEHSDASTDGASLRVSLRLIH